MNVKKGSPGYYKGRRLYTFLRTVIYFAISAALFIIGYVTTKTQANLLTIVAVLGVLPSAKSAIAFIMYMRTKDCPNEVTDRIEAVKGSAPVLYEIYLTTYDKNYALDAVLCTEDRLVCYTADKDLKTDDCIGHITRVLAVEKIHDVNVQIVKDIAQFCRMVENNAHRQADERAVAIMEALKRVSL